MTTKNNQIIMKTSKILFIVCAFLMILIKSFEIYIDGFNSDKLCVILAYIASLLWLDSSTKTNDKF
jgi:hypothetical protein